MQKRAFIIFLILSVLWTAFIFCNSIKTADYSGKQSKYVVDIVVRILETSDVSYDVEALTYMIRKQAHAFEFALQAVFIAMTISCKYIKLRRFTVHILFFGLLTAVADEYIQLFSSGRSSSIADVVLDFAGYLIGLSLFGSAKFLFGRLRGSAGGKNRTSVVGETI